MLGWLERSWREATSRAGELDWRREQNVEICAVMERVHHALRAAVAGGVGKIKWHPELEYFNGHLGDWNEPALAPKIALTKLAGKR